MVEINENDQSYDNEQKRVNDGDQREDCEKVGQGNDDHTGLNREDTFNDDPSRTMYVCRMSLSTTIEDLKSLFSEYGTVADCRIVTNPVSKESRGFGFVTMSAKEEASSAREALDGKDYQGAILRVEMAKRSKPYDPTPGEYKGPQARSVKYHSYRGPRYSPGRDSYHSRYDGRRGDNYRRRRSPERFDYKRRYGGSRNGYWDDRDDSNRHYYQRRDNSRDYDHRRSSRSRERPSGSATHGYSPRHSGHDHAPYSRRR